MIEETNLSSNHVLEAGSSSWLVVFFFSFLFKRPTTAPKVPTNKHTSTGKFFRPEKDR